MPQAPSQAQVIFGDYTGPNGPSLLLNLPAGSSKVFETEWLDFKSGKVQPNDIPKIWSKALGAFANNEGGVVVWGIVAEKDPATGIDAVQRVEMVPDIFWLKSRLQELHRQANDPPVPQVEIRELPAVAGSNQGFVVCLIPESPFKPHRSEQADKNFYIRMGDNSSVCSVSLLRQLFYPRVHHRVTATVRTISPPAGMLNTITGPHGDKHQLVGAFRFFVRNSGKSTITGVYLTVSCEGQKDVWKLLIADGGLRTVTPWAGGEWFRNDLHPEMIATVDLFVAALQPPAEFIWKLQIHARDMEPRSARISFPGAAPVGDERFIECT